MNKTISRIAVLLTLSVVTANSRAQDNLFGSISEGATKMLNFFREIPALVSNISDSVERQQLKQRLISIEDALSQLIGDKSELLDTCLDFKDNPHGDARNDLDLAINRLQRDVRRTSQGLRLLLGQLHRQVNDADSIEGLLLMDINSKLKFLLEAQVAANHSNFSTTTDRIRSGIKTLKEARKAVRQALRSL